MGRGLIFGTYYEADSPIHALDPRTKFLGALAATIIGFFAWSALSLLMLCLFTAICYAIAKVPFRVAVRAVAPLMFIVVITMILNLLFVSSGEVLVSAGPILITTQGVHDAIFFGIRLTVFLLIMCLYTLTTTTIDIADSFEKLLAPFKRLGVPAREISLMMGIALGFLPQFSREFSSIRRAQQSRGSKLPTAHTRRAVGLTALLVPLFTSVFRHADTLSQAMDSRCYRGGIGRTRLNPMAFTRADGVAVLAIAVLLAAVIACNVLGPMLVGLL